MLGQMARTQGAAQSHAPAPEGTPHPKMLAQLALDLIDRFHTHPTPRAYEVFYGYATNYPGGLRADVDAAAGDDGVLKSFDLERIHFEHFRSAEGAWERQEQTSVKIESELSGVLSIVGEQIQTGARYGERLEIMTGEMKRDVSPVRLRKIVDGLIEESEVVRTKTSRITDGLSESRGRLQAVKGELAEARAEGLRDALTGVDGRRHFEASLREHIACSDETGARLLLCLVDIDHMTRINERFGHPTGDALLRSYARIMAKEIRGPAGLARIDAKVFALTLPGSERHHALDVAETIRRTFEQKRLVLRETKTDIGRVTASFAVVAYRSGEDPDDLLLRAHDLVREAKRRGRNRVLDDREAAD
ncbi:MAG: GGDEF domain-containing protein [Pseudomonadota bacterium]